MPRRKTAVDPTEVQSEVVTEPVETTPTATTIQVSKEDFLYKFPATQGYQGGKVFWTATVRVKDLKRLFIVEKPWEISTMDWHQRSINPSQVKAIVKYIEGNPKDFAFTAITATINANAKFREVHPDIRDLGILEFPLDTKCFLVDGQHRVSALLEVSRSSFEFDGATLPVVFYLDLGDKRRKQLFLDFNQGSKVSKSVLCRLDQRDEASTVTQKLITQVDFFKFSTNLEKVALGPNDSQLFTVNGLKDANKYLLKAEALQECPDRTAKVLEFWETVFANMTDWQRFWRDRTSASFFSATKNLRDESLSVHAIAVVALGMVGAEIIGDEDWKEKLTGLKRVDWSRFNSDWENICTRNYKIYKNTANTRSLANYVISHFAAEEEIDLEEDLTAEVEPDGESETELEDELDVQIGGLIGLSKRGE